MRLGLVRLCLVLLGLVRVGLVPFRLLLCLPDSLCSTARKNDVAVWLGAV